VVQNGVRVRMQLFRTQSKGWGLRCLDDIPKGTFVCTYAGHLLTEEMSDTRGQELGDEYFAELDFVDCLLKLREDSSNNFENSQSDVGSDSETATATAKSDKKKPEKRQQCESLTSMYLFFFRIE
jgi:histone-lysine N-methyltransferase SETDB1